MSERDWFLAFVTRVKHEDLYIREWLEYHLLVGVEHFFLYDMDGGTGPGRNPRALRGRRSRDPHSVVPLRGEHAWTGRRPFFVTTRAPWRIGTSRAASAERVCWAQKIDGDEFLSGLSSLVVPPSQAWYPRPIRPGGDAPNQSLFHEVLRGIPDPPEHQPHIASDP